MERERERERARERERVRERESERERWGERDRERERPEHHAEYLPTPEPAVRHAVICSSLPRERSPFESVESRGINQLAARNIQERQPLAREEGITQRVSKTFALKLAQAKAGIWP